MLAEAVHSVVDIANQVRASVRSNEKQQHASRTAGVALTDDSPGARPATHQPHPARQPQMLLRIGIKKAQKAPSEQHPYGYARDQFIWPLISAVGIFCCGAGVSFVHGISGLFEADKVVGDLFWNFVVLGVSAVLESHSLYVAVDTLRRRATQQGMSLLAYIKTGG
jgi:divalent metal cation (Fe/Co/Zn/Cd) transporter